MATFPILYGEASTGKIKQWSICVRDQQGLGVIVIEHGYEGGKQQVIQKTLSEGKNVGKKNETTPLQQAVSEAQAQWVKKRESGYAERASVIVDGVGDRGVGDRGEEDRGEEEKEQPDDRASLRSRGKGSDASVPSVMLAHDYHKRGKSISFPCFVQRKLDGVRCVGIPGKGLFSRNKKTYPHMEHIVQEVSRLHPGLILDGELYSDTLTFQEIVGLVKRETLQPGDEEKQKQIKFHVYDLVSSQPYSLRMANLSLLFRRHRFRYLVPVPTEPCENEEEMKEKHAHYVADGYEGIMLRNRDGSYKGVRSVELQKYKEFLDGEYEVVGWEEGQGLEEGCVIWLCQTVAGKRFSCRPRGSREERQALFQVGSRYVGKYLTVRYQEETDEGLPRFPVGISFRDFE
jgi:ATP-dependent DNA ligase